MDSLIYGLPAMLGLKVVFLYLHLQTVLHPNGANPYFSNLKKELIYWFLVAVSMTLVTISDWPPAKLDQKFDLVLFLIVGVTYLTADIALITAIAIKRTKPKLIDLQFVLPELTFLGYSLLISTFQVPFYDRDFCEI